MQAELGKVNQKCQVLEELNKKQWCDFNIKEAAKAIGKAVINIRFK